MFFFRFSKDQDVLDNNLPHAIQDCFECGVIVLCSISLICILTPWFVIPLLVLGMVYLYLNSLVLVFMQFAVYLYYHVQKFYRRTSREIKRLESISRSPVSFNAKFSIFNFKLYYI